MIYPEYDSPLVVNIVNQMAESVTKQIDDMCVKAIQSVSVGVDEKTLIEALKQDSSRYREAYKKGFESGYEKRENEIIRCKDCRWRGILTSKGIICDYNSEQHGQDWFCAEGIPMEDE